MPDIKYNISSVALYLERIIVISLSDQKVQLLCWPALHMLRELLIMGSLPSQTGLKHIIGTKICYECVLNLHPLIQLHMNILIHGNWNDTLKSPDHNYHSQLQT